MTSDRVFSEKTATCEQLQAHLHKNAAEFSVPLQHRVDIAAYAEKIFKNAMTFEAWQDGAQQH